MILWSTFFLKWVFVEFLEKTKYFDLTQYIFLNPNVTSNKTEAYKTNKQIPDISRPCFLCNIPYLFIYNQYFSIWVLDEVQLKKSSKSRLFDQNMGIYSRKPPKTGLLKRGEVVFKSGAVYEQIRYLLSSKSTSIGTPLNEGKQ